MNGLQGASVPDFELTVEEGNDARPLPGFHVTRTRTLFVDNYGQVYLLAAPGHRTMLQRTDALPPDAEPTQAVIDPGLWLMARAAQSLGRGDCELTALRIADYYMFRGRLFCLKVSQVFELRHETDSRFIAVSALPAGARPLSEVEIEHIDGDVRAAARRLADEPLRNH